VKSDVYKCYEHVRLCHLLLGKGAAHRFCHDSEYSGMSALLTNGTGISKSLAAHKFADAAIFVLAVIRVGLID
jgi:hypothetical protein